MKKLKLFRKRHPMRIIETGVEIWHLTENLILTASAS